MTGGTSSNNSFSAPFGGEFLSPGIYTNVSFPTPITSTNPLEPPILEPEVPAAVQLEQERLEKLATLQELLRKIQPFNLMYLGNFWVTPVNFPIIQQEMQDFSDMPKLTRMDC